MRLTRDAILARIDAHPLGDAPAEMRTAFAALIRGADIPLPDGAHVEMRADGSARVTGDGSGPEIVWLHGGGYVFGSSETHSAPAAALEGCRVVVPDYRLAPEHPWPAPLEDARAVLDALGPVPVVGDSAGGHLALLLAQGGGVTRLGLISPNTDRSGESATRVANSARDLMNDDAADTRLWRMAMPGVAPDDPAASPLLAVRAAGGPPSEGRASPDLGLPPVWITASTDEVLLDDSLLLVRALGRAGVPVTARIETGLMHMWTLWPDLLPQARATLAELAQWLRAPVAGTGRGETG